MKTTKVFFIFDIQTHFFWILKVKTEYKFVTKPIFCGVSQFIVPATIYCLKSTFSLAINILIWSLLSWKFSELYYPTMICSFHDFLIQMVSIYMSSVGNIVEEAKLEAHDLDFFSFIWIQDSYNKAAVALAMHIILVVKVLIWLEEIPSHIARFCRAGCVMQMCTFISESYLFYS